MFKKSLFIISTLLLLQPRIRRHWHNDWFRRQYSVQNVEIQTADQRLFVVLSTTLTTAARPEDYAFLAPLVALSWFFQGFQPIIIVVTDDLAVYNSTKDIWSLVLPPNTVLVPIVANRRIAVTVAQISRLFAQYLVPWLPEEAYLRVTDGDMMIFNDSHFKPSFSHDISIHNGDCCRGNFTPDSRYTSRTLCNQYPMHSVGMKVKLWKTLFFFASKESPTTCVLELASSLVESSKPTSKSIVHGGKGWFSDQLILGCRIDDVIEKNEYSVQLLPVGRLRRVHLEDIPNIAPEVHLAAFKLSHHHQWMEKIISQSLNFRDIQKLYTMYTSQWIEQNGIVTIM